MAEEPPAEEDPPQNEAEEGEEDMFQKEVASGAVESSVEDLFLEEEAWYQSAATSSAWSTSVYSDENLAACFKKKEENQYRWELLSEAEKKHHSKIYIDIIMDIGTQNRILNLIKKKLKYLTTDNPCPTKCEKREIRGMKCCLKREMLRQYCYMRKAQEFLAKAPIGPWDGLPIICSEAKECMQSMLSCTITDAICKQSLEPKAEDKDE